MTVFNLKFWAVLAIAAIPGIAGAVAYFQLKWLWALALPILAIVGVILWVEIQRTVTVTIVLSNEADTVTIRRFFRSKTEREYAEFKLRELIDGEGLRIDTETIDNFLSKFSVTRWLTVGTLSFLRKGDSKPVSVAGLADPQGLVDWLKARRQEIKDYEEAEAAAKKKEENRQQITNMAAAIREAMSESGSSPK